MADNRCVRIYDLKQKIKYHPEVGTYVSEEDIDLMERVFIENENIDDVGELHPYGIDVVLKNTIGNVEGLGRSGTCVGGIAM